MRRRQEEDRVEKTGRGEGLRQTDKVCRGQEEKGEGEDCQTKGREDRKRRGMNADR